MAFTDWDVDSPGAPLLVSKILHSSLTNPLTQHGANCLEFSQPGTEYGVRYLLKESLLAKYDDNAGVSLRLVARCNYADATNGFYLMPALYACLDTEVTGNYANQRGFFAKIRGASTFTTYKSTVYLAGMAGGVTNPEQAYSLVSQVRAYPSTDVLLFAVDRWIGLRVDIIQQNRYVSVLVYVMLTAYVDAHYFDVDVSPGVPSPYWLPMASITADHLDNVTANNAVAYTGGLVGNYTTLYTGSYNMATGSPSGLPQRYAPGRGRVGFALGSDFNVTNVRRGYISSFVAKCIAARE